MRRHPLGTALALALTFWFIMMFSVAAIAQTKPQPSDAPKASTIDPAHDLSGVWMLDHTRPLTVVERYWM